jgi:diguanylate cyclase (GGDEF)-like protein
MLYISHCKNPAARFIFEPKSAKIMENLLRVELDIYALLLVAVMMISLSRRPLREGPPLERYFFLIAGSIAFILVLDALSWALDGIPESGARFALHLTNTLYYMLYLVPLVIFTLFIDHISRQGTFPGGGMLHALALVIIVLFAAAAFTSPWTEAFYDLDATNHYVRGRLFNALVTASFLIGFIPECILFARRRNMPKRIFRLLALYPIPILIGGLFQFYREGSAMLWPAATVSLLLVHITIQQRSLNIDAISGLYNQAAFMEMLQNWAANSLNSGNAGNSGNSDNFGAILFDIDNFKRINFDSGYEKGNEVLLATGYAIKSVLGPRDIAARVGADEFIVLSPAGAPALEDLESQILAQVREIVIAGIDQEFTVSSAHAVFDQSAHPSIDSFLQTLDSLLYKKKESLKNVPLQPELPLS